MSSVKSLDAYAAYLAMRHAQDQEEIAAGLVLALSPIWTILQFADLDATTPAWIYAALPRVRTAYLQSQRVTAVYTTNVRYASLPLEDPLPIRVPDVEQPSGLSPGAFQMPDPGIQASQLEDFGEPFNPDDVGPSLVTEANFKTKKQVARYGQNSEIWEKAEARTAGNAIRKAMDGGRGVASNVVRRDRRVLGYARVCDSNPCGFCALLASRGAVYKKDSFAANNGRRLDDRKSDREFRPNPNGAKNLPDGFLNVAKVHDFCQCTLRPVYTKSSAMDSAAKYWREAWNRIYNADPYRTNGEMIADFKQWHEANPWQGVQFDIYALDKDLADRKQALLDSGFAPDSPQVRWADWSRGNLAA